MIKPFMNGKEVTWNDKQLQLKWARTSCRRSRCTSPATGRRRSRSPAGKGDGVIIQLADPDIIQWIMDTARKAAEEAGRDPTLRAQVHRLGAEPHLRRPRRRARAGALVPGDGLEPRHGPDRPLRHDSEIAARADRLRQGAQVLRLRPALARRRHARRVRDRRDLRPLLRARYARAGDGEAEGARVDRRRPVQHLPDDRTGRRRRSRPTGATSSRASPGSRHSVGARERRRPGRRSPTGWARRHELLSDSMRPVTERLLELLDAQPGDRVLELGAGLGEVGSCSRRWSAGTARS